MTKLILLGLSLALLTACSSSFKHRLPVRESYRQIELGKPLPPSVEPTDRIQIGDAQVLVGMSVEHEWKYSTGATEWAMYLINADGAVVSKRYIVDGDEVTFMPFYINRISEVDWSWLMQPHSSDPYTEAHSICAKLKPEAFGWRVSSYDIQAMSDDGAVSISADPVLELAKEQDAWMGDHFDFSSKIELEKSPPVTSRTLRYNLISEGCVAKMAEYRYLRISGTQMTTMGWASSIRDGELP